MEERKEGPSKLMTCEGCKFLRGIRLEEDSELAPVCVEERVFISPGMEITMKNPKEKEFPLSTFLQMKGDLPIPNPNCPFLEK